MSAPPGICPRCDTAGAVGVLCATRACGARSCHCVPPEDHQAARDQPDALIGQMIGDYLVVGILGSGGFGTVYLARQQPIMMKAALKLLTRGRGGERGDSAADPGGLLRKFRGEAEALAALSHPNIVRLVKYGVHRDRPYLVMEYVDGGRTLADVLRLRGPLEPRLVVHIAGQIANALEAAHAHGIIHRDIKPANVMLQTVPGEPNLVRLLDFGLAKFLDSQGGETSAAIGTPFYMAPEQLGGGGIAPATDLYALGVVAFELLAGARPYPGDSAHEVIVSKLDPAFDASSAVEASQALTPAARGFFRRALAHLPSERFASATELRAALPALAAHAGPVATLPGTVGDTWAPAMSASNVTERAWSAPAPTPKRRPRMLAAAVGGLALVAGVAVAVTLAVSGPSGGDTALAEALPDADPPQEALPTCDPDAPQTCMELGDRFRKGQGVDKDEKRAAELYSDACGAGLAQGCYRLGQAYAHGRGVPADRAKAATLLRGACEDDVPWACYRLGQAVRRGRGVPRDDVQAIRLLRAACEGGVGKGCTAAEDIRAGLMAPPGANEAGSEQVARFEKACEVGETQACFWAGGMLHAGLVVAPDWGRAARLYRKACDLDHAQACFALGGLYAAGAEGIDADKTKAAALYEKACNGGNGAACLSVGHVYQAGDGVRADGAKANRAYKKACAGGYDWGCKLVSHKAALAVAPEAPRMLKPDYPPERLDTVTAFATATRLAQENMPDARLVQVSLDGVKPDGTVDFTASEWTQLYFSFRSPERSQGKVAGVALQCVVTVSLQREQMIVVNSTSQDCAAVAIDVNCTPRQIWTKLANTGVPTKDAVARMLLVDDGKGKRQTVWHAMVGDELRATFLDDCGGPIAPKLPRPQQKPH